MMILPESSGRRESSRAGAVHVTPLNVIGVAEIRYAPSVAGNGVATKMMGAAAAPACARICIKRAIRWDHVTSKAALTRHVRAFKIHLSALRKRFGLLATFASVTRG